MEENMHSLRYRDHFYMSAYSRGISEGKIFRCSHFGFSFSPMPWNKAPNDATRHQQLFCIPDKRAPSHLFHAQGCSRRMRRGSFLLVPRWGRGKASGLQRGETSGTRPSLFFSKKSIPADRSRIQSRSEFPREEKAARRCFFSHTHTVPAEGFFQFQFSLIGNPF